MTEPKYDWKESNDSYYYYQVNGGDVVGQIHKIAHSSIWLAKIIIKNDEEILGRYISLEWSKIAVENHWFIEGRTLLEKS